MNHSEAVEQMASERYLLNELTPDARDAFEEHVFDCPECALDLRAGTLFVHEAKVQLPELVASQDRIRDVQNSARSGISGFHCGAPHLLLLPLRPCSSWLGTKTSSHSLRCASRRMSLVLPLWPRFTPPHVAPHIPHSLPIGSMAWRCRLIW